MGNNTETQQMSKGQERRLAKKKAAAAQKRQKKASKAIFIVAAAVIVCAIAAGITIFAVKKAKETKVVSDFSQGLTDDGKIAGVDVKSLTTVFDYKNITVKYSDIAYSDDDIQKDIETLLKDYETEDENGNKTTPEFNDEFVKEYLDMETVEEYKESVRAKNEETNLHEYLEKLLVSETKISQIPQSYFKTLKGLRKYVDQNQFEYYNNMFMQYYGQRMYKSFKDFTGMTDAEYEEYLTTSAMNDLKGDMGAQYIFETEGMIIPGHEYVEYAEDFASDAESQYGKGYIMKNLIHEKVMEFIQSNAKIEK
jgi:FKBP-type peptidyl-prolyl cis-trans isomerase (trigger factor)